MRHIASQSCCRCQAPWRAVAVVSAAVPRGPGGATGEFRCGCAAQPSRRRPAGHRAGRCACPRHRRQAAACGGAGARPQPAAAQVPPTPPCENGTGVTSPAANPGLMDDCVLLLAAKDTLRGTETNWSVDTAIANWEGITVSGSPSRVTGLHLDRNTSGPLYGRTIPLSATPAEVEGGDPGSRRAAPAGRCAWGVQPGDAPAQSQPGRGRGAA